MASGLDLRLPPPERRLAARLAGRWEDLLYVPGPGLSSSLDPGLHRSSFVVVLAGGPAVRVSSFVVPAFGADLCRLRLETVREYRPAALGSCFEPARRGTVYAFSADRRTGGPRPPDEAEWIYRGEPLAPRLGRIQAVRVLTEQASAVAGDAPVSWIADRGLVLTGAGGTDSLLLAEPDREERAALLPAPGLYRALLDPGAAAPGATVRELLGYGDWEGRLDVRVELAPVRG